MTGRNKKPSGGKMKSVSIKHVDGTSSTVSEAILEELQKLCGCSLEEIQLTISECNGDVNEAATRLVENPFEAVHSKKEKRILKEKKAEAAGAAQTTGKSERREQPSGQRVVEVRRGPAYDRDGRPSGSRGQRADKGDFQAPRQQGSGSKQFSAKHSRPTGPSSQPPGSRTSEPAAQTQQPQMSAPSQPPPFAPGKVSFTDVLRGSSQSQSAPPQAAPPVQASLHQPMSDEPHHLPGHELDAGEDAQVPLEDPTQRFAEKLTAAQASAPPLHQMEEPGSTGIGVPYGQPAKSAGGDAAAAGWGAPESPSSVQTATSLAGLLSGKNEEEPVPGLHLPAGVPSSTAAESLSLQFGQFGLGSSGMGDFGAGFGSGFGDDLGAREEQPQVQQQKQPIHAEPEKAQDSAVPPPAGQPSHSFDAPAGYGYNPPSAPMSNLSHVVKPAEPTSAPQPAAPAANVSMPHYAQPNAYQYALQPPPALAHGNPGPAYPGPDEAKAQRVLSSQDVPVQPAPYGQPLGRNGPEDFPSSSAPAQPKYAVQPPRQGAGGLANPEAPSTSNPGSAPPGGTPPQPVVPQMPFPGHGIPPALAAQYGYLPHAQYPYLHSANMYMYPNPYGQYGAGAYPPQAGASNFPPSAGNTSFPNQVPSAGGPMKFGFQYSQTSQTPSSGVAPVAPGAYAYNQGAYSADEPVGSAYNKEPRDPLYGASVSQGAPQMPRDNIYAYMSGQAFQPQGFSAGAQGQFGNSPYAQYMMAQYALGGQMHPPNVSGQSGSSQNNYKMP